MSASVIVGDKIRPNDEDWLILIESLAENPRYKTALADSVIVILPVPDILTP